MEGVLIILRVGMGCVMDTVQVGWVPFISLLLEALLIIVFLFT